MHLVSCFLYHYSTQRVSINLQVSEGISKQYCLPFSGTKTWKENSDHSKEHPITYGAKDRLTELVSSSSITKERKTSPLSLESKIGVP